jgi:hypothetical protein
MKRLWARSLFTLLIALSIGLHAQTALATANADASTNANQEKRRAVEMTFLKSQPGKREQLKRFVTANWFAMDEVAIKQGLMQSYRLLDSGDDAEPWNVLVMVTYRDARGYDGIKTEFETIRKAHTKVLVDGLDFRDLGRIVESRKTFEPL